MLPSGVLPPCSRAWRESRPLRQQKELTPCQYHYWHLTVFDRFFKEPTNISYLQLERLALSRNQYTPKLFFIVTIATFVTTVVGDVSLMILFICAGIHIA